MGAAGRRRSIEGRTDGHRGRIDPAVGGKGGRKDGRRQEDCRYQQLSRVSSRGLPDEPGKNGRGQRDGAEGQADTQTVDAALQLGLEESDTQTLDAALHLGVEPDSDAPTAVESTSWGKVKDLLSR